MSGKKSLITLLVLAVVFVGLFFGYKALKAGNAESEAEAAESEEAAKTFVNTYDSEGMKLLSFEKDGTTLSFEKNANDAWFLPDDPNYPIDSSTVNNMANAVSGLAADRETGIEDDEEFGINAPSLRVTGEYEDGSKLDLVFGITNDFNSKVYLKDAIASKTYMVESSVASAFAYTKESLMRIDSMPDDIEKDYLTSMTVRNADGVENTVTDTVGLEDSYTLFNELDFRAENAFFADEDKMTECGITNDSPYVELAYKAKVTVSNEDGSMETVRNDASYRFNFGKKHTVMTTETDENGNDKEVESVCYYYTTPGSSIVYSAKEAVYEELMRYATYEPEETEETSAETTAESAE